MIAIQNLHKENHSVFQERFQVVMIILEEAALLKKLLLKIKDPEEKAVLILLKAVQMVM